jgi:hypothetical protein
MGEAKRRREAGLPPKGPQASSKVDSRRVLKFRDPSISTREMTKLMQAWIRDEPESEAPLEAFLVNPEREIKR